MKLSAGILFGTLFFTKAWSQQEIDTAYAVKIGGISQWINIKGQDSNMPLCLWLHGGPGGSDMKYSHKFSNKLNKRFVFVEWDQRASGRTAMLNRSEAISLKQVHNDVFEMITYLLRRYHRNKLLIIGNSWGGFLALYVAKQHPELLEACVLVSPSIYFDESENMSLAYVRKEAKDRKDDEAIKETDSIKLPFQTPGDLWLLRKWLYTFHGERLSRVLPPEKVFVEIAGTWFDVIKEWETFNSFTEIPKIDIPIFFILGKQDYITHFEITQKFYNNLEAKQKELYWLDAGHMIITERPRQMQEIIIDQILPSLIF